MAGICDLPPEMIISIMHLCNMPYDLSVLIQVSRHFLRIFLSNRHQIMTPVVDDLEARFGGLVPRMCLLAAHLRHIRCNRSDGSSSRDLERKFESAKSTCFKLPEGGVKLDQTHSLLLVCSLSMLLTEAEWVMRGYVPRAWLAEMDDSGLRWTAPKEKQIATLHEKFALLGTVRQRVFHSIFCFESYCQMYFLGKEQLFVGRVETPQFMMEIDESNRSIFKRTNAFHAIVHYVCQPYWVLYLDIDDEIQDNGKSLSSALQNSCATDGPEQAHVYLDRFNRRTTCEMNRFVHFMLTQGIGMLFTVKMMDRQDQFIFILESFYSFVTNFEPVPVLHGSNCYCDGRLEEYSPRLWDHVEAVCELCLSDWLPAGISFISEYHAEQKKWEQV